MKTQGRLPSAFLTPNTTILCHGMRNRRTRAIHGGLYSGWLPRISMAALLHRLAVRQKTSETVGFLGPRQFQ